MICLDRTDSYRMSLIGSSNFDIRSFELNFENFVTFATKGTLADLGPFTSADDGFDGGAYYQRAFDAFAVDGTQYALPESYSTVLLFYNQEIFDAAGLDYPTDGWTWDDERSAAEALAATGDGVWGHFAGVHYWEFYKAAFQNGCSFFGDGGAVTVTGWKLPSLCGTSGDTAHFNAYEV